MLHVKNVLKITAKRKLQNFKITMKLNYRILKENSEQGIYLGSAQNDVLSSSGTTNVRFKNRAIVTMSHI